MCLWWTQDVWPRFLSRKGVLFQVLAVWSVGSLQLSASSELHRVASPKNMLFPGQPMSSDQSLWEYKAQATSANAGQFQGMTYATELSGVSQSFLRIALQFSFSLHPILLPPLLSISAASQSVYSTPAPSQSLLPQNPTFDKDIYRTRGSKAARMLFVSHLPFSLCLCFYLFHSFHPQKRTDCYCIVCFLKYVLNPRKG